METKYREMFDQVRASERLRKEVMEMTKQEKTAPKRRIPRAGLIAAALALALAGTAIAAAYRVHIQNFTPEQLAEEGADDGYAVLTDVEPTPLEDFSQEAREAAADAERPWGQVVRAPEDRSPGTKRFSWSQDFETWEEAEEFLGIQVPGIEGATRLSLFARDGELVRAYLDVDVEKTQMQEPADGINLDVQAALYTEAYLENPEDDVYFFHAGPDSDVKSREISIRLSGGEEATVITSFWDDGGGAVFGFLVRENIRYEVQALCLAGEEEAALKEVESILRDL